MSDKALLLKEKENLIDNVWAFRFVPRQPLDWTAGQYIRVELPHDNPDDKGAERWFTVTSAPCEDIVQITTRLTGSTFKQALAALPIGGELLLLEPPEGDFVWEDSSKPLVFVAGGIGITPFRSILKQRACDGQSLNVTLVYGNRTDAILFKDEFDSYAFHHPEFRVHYVVGEPLSPGSIAKRVPELNSSLVYVSGPEPMVQALSQQLQGAGLPKDFIKTDEFPSYTEKNY